MAPVRFTYNQHDDLTKMQDALGSTDYTYNADHSLWTVTDPNGFVVTYNKYDAAGNLEELIYPGNKKVKYTYDALNRLETVTIDWLPSTPVARYYYDEAGRLDWVRNFNGSITDYGYDNANRLISLENKKSDTTTILASYSFTLDGNGNRMQITQTEPLTLTPNTETVSYTYNTQKNRLLTANTTNFGYDDEGQLYSNSYDSYVFDAAHRLININSSNYNYYYDGRGNRLNADRDWWSNYTSYVYDAGGNLLMEVDTVRGTSYYIHGLGLMAMVTPANQVYTYHFNAVGSTIAMTDSTQAVVNKYSYDEFGNISANSVENVPQPFKFVGQYGVMTEPNGFYYMRARYYDPEVGRFISEDPIGFDGGDTNLCAYAGNNPILLIDPFGLEPPKNIPSGVSIAANVEKARNMTIFKFYNTVKGGGDWDYKQLDPKKYQDFGNYNYGVTGMAAGFSEYELKTAAGAYQMYKGTSDIDWLLPWSKTYAYGDDPNDQKWINEGIKDYKSSYGRWYGCSGTW